MTESIKRIQREISMRYALRKIEIEDGYMPKAPDVEPEW